MSVAKGAGGVSPENGAGHRSSTVASVLSARRRSSTRSNKPAPQAAKGEAQISFKSAVTTIMTLQKFTKQRTAKAHSETRRPMFIRSYLKENRLLIEQELVQLPIFQGCSHEFVSQLSSVLGGRSLPVGHAIVTQGEPASSLVVILRGSAQMLVNNLPVMRLASGHWFGETALLGIEDTWGAGLKAETPCTVVDLPRKQFLEVLHCFSTESRMFNSITSRQSAEECKTAGTLAARIELFDSLSADVMDNLHQLIVRRIVFPKEKILEEGTAGDEMYILVRGTVVVEIAGKVIRHEGQDTVWTEDTYGGSAQKALTPRAFGELGLLGMTPTRTASVVADSVCQLRVVFRPVLLRILERHRDLVPGFFRDYLLKHSAPEPDTFHLNELSIFQDSGCGAGFLDFLTQHLEGRVYWPGQRIVDEAQPDDGCMYLLCDGSAEVLKDSKRLTQLHAGAVFGHMPMFGLNTKLSTVAADFTCYVRVLHRGVVMRGLELFPNERQKVMMMAFQHGGVPPGMNLGSDYQVFALDQESDVRAAFMKVLKSSPLFAKTNPAFVEELSACAIDRIYMPGDIIIEEGQRGDSMFIMVSGQAGVFVSDPEALPASQDGKEKTDARTPGFDKPSMVRVGVLRSGGISGELAMLGILPMRSATIKADQICSMWEITQEKALVILDRFPDAQKHFADLVVSHMGRTAATRISSLPLFQAFDAKFRVLLGLYCECRALFPGQTIAREGQKGDALHIVNVGIATLRKKGVVIKTYSGGSHFGSTVMLGLHKAYLGTLTVLQTCHVLTISRSSYLQALETYPSMDASQQLKRTELAATEELRQAMQRISARKMIWKRYQHLVFDGSGQLPGNTEEGQEHGLEMLGMVVQQWHAWARSQHTHREQCERKRLQYERMMEHWLKKKETEKAKVQHRKDREQQLQDLLAQRMPKVWPLPLLEEKDDMVGCTGEAPALPPVSVIPARAMAEEAAVRDRQAQLSALISDWPCPRQSSHYTLKVWKVMASMANEEPRLPTPPAKTAAFRPASTPRHRNREAAFNW